MQSASLPEGCSWGVGYGIIRTPIAVVPTPHSPKDVCHVAPPVRHRACAGRNRPCRPRRLSQRPSLSHVPGCSWDPLSGRRLCYLIPTRGPTGLTPVAAGVGDHYAVSGEPGGSPGGGGGPRAHRLEVPAES